MGPDLELTGVRKDGSEVPVEISLSPLRQDDETLVITIVRDVSERRAAELRFRTLIETAPDSILLVDSLGEITLANKQSEELFGYSAEELLGRPIELLVPERFRGGHLGHRQTYMTESRTRPMGAGLELHGLRKDGSEFPLEVSLSPLRTGSETLVCTIVRDVSQRKAAEAERLELAGAQAANIEAEAAAARLRAVQEVTEAALGHLSLDELLKAVLQPVRMSLDADAARILLLDDDRGTLVERASIGLSPTNVEVPLGRGVAGAIAMRSGPTVFDDLSEAVNPQLEEAGISSVVGAPLQVAGAVVGVIYAGTTHQPGFTADDAQLLQVFADRIALAISHARLYEAELQARAATEAAQSRLSEIIGDLDAIVWEADTSERVRFTFVGGRALDILGYPLERWTAQDHSWRGLIHPDDRETTLLFFAEAAAERRPHELEYRLQAADGRLVWVNDKVRVVGEGPGPPRVRGVMVDVTERRELGTRLMHSQKMEAVGRLAGGIAHDFNNLLTVITGFASAARGDASLDGDAARRASRRSGAAASGRPALTRQLLAFSRRAGARSRACSTSNAVVVELEQMLRRLIGEDVELADRACDRARRRCRPTRARSSR